jgi:hypothetical protein
MAAKVAADPPTRRGRIFRPHRADRCGLFVSQIQNPANKPENTMPATPRALFTLVAVSFLVSISSVPAETLFSHTFDEGAGGLDGAPVDVGTGNWVAADVVTADGAFATGPGSATLPFVPASGEIYTLDARISGVAGDQNWVALGFANGQSTADGNDNRFITGNVAGTAWMLFRGDNSSHPNTAFLGDGTLNSGDTGITDGVGWSALNTSGGDIDMRVLLDTTGGSGTWKVTWLAKNPADADYTVVRPEAAVLDEANFTSVGFAFSSAAIGGTLESFSLGTASGPDTTPPSLVSLSPADDAGSVPVGGSLAAQFNETVRAGTGTLTLHLADDGSVVGSYEVGSAPELAISGTSLTLDPTDDLAHGTTYYVRIPSGTIEDDAGNAFPGITDPTAWNFTTAAAPSGALEPYPVDANTRHLWHFDEADPGPAEPAAGLTGSFSLTPESGATLGAASAPGFATAGDTAAGSAAGFRGAVIPVSDVTGPDGAFTFEAILQTANITDLQQIIAMENAGGSVTDRPFQFRIDGGDLRFINVSTGPQSILAPIPTSGPDAFVPGEWFHVAVAYNGSQGTAENIRLFWTRVDATRVAANEILAATMTGDLAGIATTFGVGQEFRSPSDNLKGSIDEVRISDIARTANDFLFLAPDTDGDGLADPWEILHFRESPEETEAEILAKHDGTDDPDGDGFDNEAEETAGTDPNDPDHTPLDADQDGYEDAWEIETFGTIAYGPDDDPDGDGFTTAEELAAGTDPANPLSNPDDTDADGLPDAWEIQHFGDLSQGPRDDFDGDGATNREELSAGTDPTDPTDFPLVSFIPVTDGDPATDENGYAGSAINSIAFAQNNLITVGGQQFISYYRRHASDPNHPDNDTVVVARRTLGESLWEIFPTDFTSFNINDTHNVISMAIDGDGVIHMSWGMHGNSLLYARSTGSVLGDDPIVMTSLGTGGMTGQENSVTYPKFQTLPDGDVVFLFREGGSGRGDWYLNRYDTDTDTWAPVHANDSGAQQPLMLGRGDSPDNCFYPDRLTLGPNGMLHLAGVFRYNADSLAGESGYQTNHRYVYLRSPDGGTTWQRSDGSAISVPVVEAGWFRDLGADHVPEIVKDLPEGHSIMNESGMTTDSAGHPIIANWWADDAAGGDHTRQYHIFFHDGSQWHQRTVSARDIDDPGNQYSEGELGSSKMGRPVVLTDADDRIFVVYNDNRFDGITVVFSLPLAQDPGRLHWTRMNLTPEHIGNWETTYDEARWNQDGVLHMLYQKLPGMGMSYGSQNNSTPVSVVEWNARAYFNSPVRWVVDMQSTPGQATVSARTRIGFHYDLKTSTDLDFSAPPAVTLPGDGNWWEFGTWPMDEARRFWRLERTEEATDDL